MNEALTFDDVVLYPCYSEVLPSQVDLRVRIGETDLDIPIISSPMDTVTGWQLAAAMYAQGGIGVIHRNLTLEAQIREVKKAGCPVWAAVGVYEYDRAKALMDAGVTTLVVDSAHGHAKGVLETIEQLAKVCTVVSGNIATYTAALDSISAGAKILRVGVGSGSICITRVVTGVGCPQWTAIKNCSRAAHRCNVPIIADGGIRWSGDIVKALNAGATAVMLGRLLAETREAPGSTITVDGTVLKAYRGMGSLGAMSGRYTEKTVAEGVEGMVPCTVTVEERIGQLVGGLRSGMGYLGAATIPELWERRALRITKHGAIESHPHGLISISERPPNY